MKVGEHGGRDPVESKTQRKKTTLQASGIDEAVTRLPSAWVVGEEEEKQSEGEKKSLWELRNHGGD